MIALKYAIFAALSTIVNIAGQMCSFAIYSGPLSLYIAMAVGIGAGLVTKFVLDKHFIFMEETKSKSEEAKTFALYSLTGVFTTVLFLGTEITFDAFFDSPNAKYVGAVVGLSMGYVTKYFLDRKYVFNRERT